MLYSLLETSPKTRPEPRPVSHESLASNPTASVTLSCWDHHDAKNMPKQRIIHHSTMWYSRVQNISFGATPVLPRKRIYRPARSPRARLTSRRRPHQAGAAEPLFCARSPPEKGPSARCSPTQVRASMVQLLMSWLRAGYEKAVTQVLLYLI